MRAQGFHWGDGLHLIQTFSWSVAPLSLFPFLVVDLRVPFSLKIWPDLSFLEHFKFFYFLSWVVSGLTSPWILSLERADSCAASGMARGEGWSAGGWVSRILPPITGRWKGFLCAGAEGLEIIAWLGGRTYSGVGPSCCQELLRVATTLKLSLRAICEGKVRSFHGLTSDARALEFSSG